MTLMAFLQVAAVVYMVFVSAVFFEIVCEAVWRIVDRRAEKDERERS